MLDRDFPEEPNENEQTNDDDGCGAQEDAEQQLRIRGQRIREEITAVVNRM